MIIAAQANVIAYQGAKFYWDLEFTDNSTGQPILLIDDSGTASFKDSAGNTILDLPPVADTSSTGVITKDNRLALNILVDDLDNFTVDDPVNFDVRVSLAGTDNEPYNPTKPIRGNFTLLQGQTV